MFYARQLTGSLFSEVMICHNHSSGTHYSYYQKAPVSQLDVGSTCWNEYELLSASNLCRLMTPYAIIKFSTSTMWLCSVLEGGRMLTLTEKGSEDAEVIEAADGFRIVATMNPGGDYGKKELSPALSNRFTQIWVPSIDKAEELLSIVKFNLAGRLDLVKATADQQCFHCLVVGFDAAG